MGEPSAEWCLEAVRGLTCKNAVALFDRAASIGLLTSLGDRYFEIHPALPWYFRSLFERFFPAELSDRARRAFIEAMNENGNRLGNLYDKGNRSVISNLAAEEDNLLAAWRLARERAWWGCVTGAMQGLRALYEENGHSSSWRRLVEIVLPDFIDPATDGPLQGREDQWSLVTEYRVRLLFIDQNWPEAERLQTVLASRNEERARLGLETPTGARSESQGFAIRSFAIALHELALIQQKRDNPGCADTFQKSFDLDTLIGYSFGQATSAFNLGNAYILVSGLRDLDKAEHWHLKALDLWSPGDGLARGKSLSSLGRINFERFQDAQKTPPRSGVGAPFLIEAAKSYEQALKLFPVTAIQARGIAHDQLGKIYASAGCIDQALEHFRTEIRYCDAAGDVSSAGIVRSDAALSLAAKGRFDDARAFAEAALANFQSIGAGPDIQRTEGLIAAINSASARK